MIRMLTGSAHQYDCTEQARSTATSLVSELKIPYSNNATSTCQQEKHEHIVAARTPAPLYTI